MADEREKSDPERPRARRPRDENEERVRPKRRNEEDEDIKPRSRRRDEEDEEDEEEEERPRRRRRRDDDDDDRMDVRKRGGDGGLNTMIPYKNPQSLISYYLGVFALIPCLGLILAPISIVLGILGLMYRSKHPTAGGTAHSWVGIILSSLILMAYIGGFIFIAAGGLKP